MPYIEAPWVGHPDDCDEGDSPYVINTDNSDDFNYEWEEG